MLTALERNKLFLENFDRITRMCNRMASRIRRAFPAVCNADLVEYAYIGMLEAIQRADFSNPGVGQYIRKYGYISAMEGVALMLGFKRSRRKKLDIEFIFRLYLMNPEELKILIEAIQETEWGIDLTFEQIDRKIDIEWMYKRLQGSYELIVLQALMEGLSVDEITKKYGIKPRRIRKIIDRLYHIYYYICRGEPYDQYITMIKKPRRKRIRWIRASKKIARRNFRLPEHEFRESIRRRFQNKDDIGKLRCDLAISIIKQFMR